MKEPTIRSYLEYMLKSPLSVWWAAATFAIEILGFSLASNTIVLSRVWLVAIIFLVSFTVFVGGLVMYKGWTIYSHAFDSIRIIDITRANNEQVFVLESWRELQIGLILEIHRNQETVEVPIGFVETTLQREDGKTQAKPAWIMPIHMRDIEQRELSSKSLVIRKAISRETLSRWVNDRAEEKLQELLKRGIEQ
jgi:hypothetical protein